MSTRGSSSPPLAALPPYPVTEAHLHRLCPSGRREIIVGIAAGFDRLAAAHAVTTRLRICHFLAQAAHETDRFRTLEEYGGAAYFARYDGRADLGNVRPGDGSCYHGRGIFQLTGRANYRRFGPLVGHDLEADPELAKQPAISLAVAFAYWRERDINRHADADDVIGVTKAINGGRNGLASRAQLLVEAKALWP
jgi:putative chitinase